MRMTIAKDWTGREVRESLQCSSQGGIAPDVAGLLK